MSVKTGTGSRLFAAIAVAATLALAGCSGDGTKINAGPAPSVGVERAAATPEAAAVSAQPADGATDASPAAPTQVTVTNGTINSVQLTNSANKAVAGQLSEDKKTWVATEPLGYDKAYTWSGTATGANGAQVPITGSFRTVKPKRTERGKLNVGDNGTYGIAMPITVTFDNAVKDKASVEKTLSVVASVPTEGGWAWLSDSAVHWRPKEYWKPNTKVTVTAKLFGTSFGNGVYGRQDVTSTFTIGRDQRTVGNTQTHRLVVTRDGVETQNYPASFGLESDPGRVSKSGVHVVSEKHEIKLMSSERYNYENIPVPWAVRISNNGEFVHGYEKSIPDQGKRNVSHGCTNLSPANAKKYYDSTLIGDPVEVVGSNQQLSSKDNAYFDWTLTWDQWLAKSALR
jgi:lipoprotein-anchoring transpeptidase ErfK/SrfK